MTNQELIALIKRPGPVMVPVLMGEDVVPVEAVKSDLIFYLKGLDPDAESGLRMNPHIDPNNETRYLDTIR